MKSDSQLYLQVEDDPYFLLAQRLANAPQVKVNANVREEGEVVPGTGEADHADKKTCPVCNKNQSDVVAHFKVMIFNIFETL